MTTAAAITTPCQDRCALSNECECGDDHCDYAPHTATPTGGVVCGCASCGAVRQNDYDCPHRLPQSLECDCVRVALGM